MKSRSVIVLMLIVPLMTGCARWLVIGESEFSCGSKNPPGLKCKSAREVYELTHPSNRAHQKRAGTDSQSQEVSPKKKGILNRMVGVFSRGGKEKKKAAEQSKTGAGKTVVDQDLAVVRTNTSHLHKDEIQYIEHGVRPYSRIHDKRFYGNSEELFEVIPTTTTSLIPIRTPPKVMRVMIASYESKEGVLHSGGYSFVEIEARKWQIGTPTQGRNDGRVRSLERVLRDNAETIAKPPSTGVSVGPINIESAQQLFSPNSILENEDRELQGVQTRERLTPEEREQERLEYHLEQQQQRLQEQ